MHKKGLNAHFFNEKHRQFVEVLCTLGSQKRIQSENFKNVHKGEFIMCSMWPSFS